MSKEISGYKVSKQTAAYIDALKSLRKAHNDLLEAVDAEQIGEAAKEAAESKILELVNPLEGYIWGQIENQITANLLADANSAGDIL